MGYFEQIDTSKLNWKTDGEIRRVNGGLTLVPHINGTDDDLYKAIIEEVLALDWKHYKLYLVGGVLEGWQTHDIDICVTGEIDDDLIPLMEAVEKLGCIDIYYVKSYNEIKGGTNRVWEFARPNERRCAGSPRYLGNWRTDGLFWTVHKFKENGREYTKEPLSLN